MHASCPCLASALLDFHTEHTGRWCKLKALKTAARQLDFHTEHTGRWCKLKALKTAARQLDFHTEHTGRWCKLKALKTAARQLLSAPQAPPQKIKGVSQQRPVVLRMVHFGVEPFFWGGGGGLNRQMQIRGGMKAERIPGGGGAKP